MNVSERIVEFPGSLGFLTIYTADNPDSIRGEYFNLVTVDEAAMIAEEVWTDVIQPTLADVDGDAILISTPKGRNWFWREFQRGLVDGVEVKSWTAPSSANPSPQIRKAAELAKTRVPDSTYRQEWLAEFVEDGQNVFSPSWWMATEDHDSRRFDWADPVPQRRAIGRWLSWDTALKDRDTSDYAAVTVAELSPDYRLHIREVWRDRLSFPDLTAQIQAFAHRYNHDGKLKGVLIEDKVSGTSAYQTLTSVTADPWLAELLIPFLPSGSKRQRASQAGVWCRNGSVLLPHPGEGVAHWLPAFEEELFGFTGSDKDEHDDMVDSLSQMLLYLENFLSEGFHARNDHAEREPVELGMGL